MGRTMKDSGVEWIGEVPKDWKVGRIGQLYSERKEKVSDRDYQPLSVTMKGILPQLSTAAKSDAHDDRKLVKTGDFAINSRSDRRGSCGIAPCDGSISLINTVLKPHEDMDAGFYNWVFHTSTFSDEFYKWGHGIVDDLWTTGWQDMKRISIPVPSLEEQTRIAVYLDKQCRNIDATIDKTTSSIEEYKKYRQSLISVEAEKLGGSLTTLGKIIERIEQGWSPSPAERDELGDWSVLTLAAVKNGRFSESEVKPFVGSLDRCESLQLQKGDFLLTRSNTRDLVGQVCIVDKKPENCIFSDLIYRVTFNEKFVDKTFMLLYFQTAAMRQQICRDAHGSSSTMVKITHKDINGWQIRVPDISKQKAYVSLVLKKCEEIDLVICKKQQLLTELQNYKKSLIYEYVTGKKEVPAV